MNDVVYCGICFTCAPMHTDGCTHHDHVRQLRADLARVQALATEETAKRHALEDEVERLRVKVGELVLFERTFTEVRGGVEYEEGEGWECAECEAGGFSCRDWIVHKPTCVL